MVVRRILGKINGGFSSIRNHLSPASALSQGLCCFAAVTCVTCSAPWLDVRISLSFTLRMDVNNITEWMLSRKCREMSQRGFFGGERAGGRQPTVPSRLQRYTNISASAGACVAPEDQGDGVAVFVPGKCRHVRLQARTSQYGVCNKNREALADPPHFLSLML